MKCWFSLIGSAVVLTVFSLATGIAGAARADGDAPQPRLVVEQTEMDLGIREPGAKMEFLFHVKNTGSAPLEIVDAKPKCGCVVAGFDRQIAPGGSGTVRATMDTANRHGLMVKHVLLFSNDPDNSEVTLGLKVTLRHAVEAAPSELTFPLQSGKSEEQVVTVRSFEPEPLRILKVVSSAPQLRAELMPKEAAAGDDEPARAGRSRERLRVFVEGDAATGALAATVTILTSSARCPRLVLHVNGYPEGAVAVFPARLYFDDLPAQLEEPIVRPITLMKRDGAFKLLSAESADPALKLQVMPDPTGHFCEIAVRYAGGWKPGLVRGAIILKTSDPARPRIEIPYSGEVTP